MSGIAGIWNRDGSPVSRDTLASMNERLAHRGLDGSAVWLDGAVGLAAQLTRVTPQSLLETQPFVGSAGVVAAFDGRLDDREQLLTLLDRSSGVSLSSPDVALAAAAYQRFGDEFASHLAGDFALAIVDARNRKVLLARDALGAHSLQYQVKGQLLVFASEIKALLAHPEVRAVPDEDTLIEMLLKGPEPDDLAATFFKDIQRVLPGGLVIITREHVEVRQAWDFDTTRKTRLKNIDEYAEAYRHYFDQSVRRRMRSAYPVAVSVSGGLDSTGIFCMAQEVRRSAPGSSPEIVGFTYAPNDGSPADETSFIEAIEKKYSVAIGRIPPATLGPFRGGKTCLWHAEYPSLDPLWDSSQELQRRVKSSGARLMLTGHWADQVLFDDAYLGDLIRTFAWPTAWKHLQEFPRWFADADPRALRNLALLNLARCYTPAALQPALKRWRRKRALARQTPLWFSERWRSRAAQPLSGRLEFRRKDSTVHASTLYRVLRSRFYQHCMDWNDKIGAVSGGGFAFPFLDRDLLQFLMSIPGDVQTFAGVPKAIHRRGLRGIMPDVVCDRRWKADFSHQANAGMEADYEIAVRELEKRRMVVELGFVDDKALTSELKAARERLSQLQGNCVEAWRLADLVALEWWLRLYFDDAARPAIAQPEHITTSSTA
jgi:asparagine synthase (glutamine-hydrolysing)